MIRINRLFSSRQGILTTLLLLVLLATGATAFAQTSLPFERITFAPGETSAQVSRDVPANTVVRYEIAASTGQEMQVAVTSPNNNVYLSVIAPDGTTLASAPAGARSFSGTLPQTGDYLFRVSTTPGLPGTTFTLNVSVTGIPLERIEFDPGATTKQLEGQVDGTEPRGYILEAQAGQDMEISLTSTTNPVYLTVISPNGTPLARAEAGAQSFDQTLPESGEYIIHVSTPAENPITSYVMNVTITGIISGPDTTQSIRFATGATSAQVSGRITGVQVNTYLLNARAGQQMQVSVASPYGDVYLTIVSPNGTPLARAQAGAQSFNGYLPETGDYQLRVLNPSGSVNSSYVLYVSVTGTGNDGGSSGGITTRITFAAGSTSAQVSGRIDGTQVNTYLLNARAGQQMQVTVTSQLADAYLTVVSPSGVPLARAQAGAQSFSGTLPENGDYRLSVSSPSGTAHSNYVLTVSVTGNTSGGSGGNTTSRITFAAGSTSGQVDGSTTRTYLLDARAGQRMIISLTSTSNPVYLTVVAPSGAVLAQASLGEQSLDRFLPDNGDYSIQVSTSPGAPATSFTLSVSVV